MVHLPNLPEVVIPIEKAAADGYRRGTRVLKLNLPIFSLPR
jgi:hypothetical protein